MKIKYSFKYYLLLLFQLIITGEAIFGQSSNPGLSAETILQKSIARLKEFTGFKYDASFKMKFFDNTDTTDFFSRQCRVIKKQQDSILKYHALLSNGGTTIGYTGQQFFMSSKKENWLKMESTAVLGRSFIRNNIGINFVPHFIYSTDPLNNWIKAAINIVRLEDSRVAGQKCYVIKFIFKADEEITLSERYLYIDKQTFLPVKMQVYAEYKGIQQEYQELVIKNLVGIKNKNAAIQYNFSPGLEPQPFDAARRKTEVPLLKEGSSAPGFTGKDLDNKPFKGEDVSGKKLLLVDFWYLACPPCLEAIPELAALQNEYSYKGLQILGLNSTDTSEKKMAEIRKFVPVLKINYPVILINKETEQAYQVTAWPTLYLIENGKIIYANKGYNKAELKNLRSIIEQHLSYRK
jgi:thiol-disulfide isomerase/thioredoxin